MHIPPLHDWRLSPAEAIALQTHLATKLRDRPIVSPLRLVAGVDVSVKDGWSQAAIVVMSYPKLDIQETVLARLPVTYPYIPGLLTFREGPVLVEAFSKMRLEPDVFIFDGMGRIHPRRMGIAAHMGLWLDKPTIGCGKTHYIGEYQMPAPHRGAFSPLMHHGEQLGVVLRTRDHVKPLYISAGHLADIDSAIALVLGCTLRYRLPEPVRAAHRAAGLF